MRARRLALVAAAALIACSTLPASAARAYITFDNKRSEDVNVRIDWAYAGAPIWFLEEEHCVHAGQRWETSVQYTRPNAGPQIRFDVAGKGNNCSSFFRLWTRMINIKDMIFKDGRQNYNASVSTDMSRPYFCLKVQYEQGQYCARAE